MRSVYFLELAERDAMTIVGFLLLLILVGLLLPLLPLDAKIKQVVVTIVIVLAVLWVVSILFGWGPAFGPGPHLR